MKRGMYASRPRGGEVQIKKLTSWKTSTNKSPSPLPVYHVDDTIEVVLPKEKEKRKAGESRYN